MTNQKFGVREICDVVFKANSNKQRVGNKTFDRGQPVLYLDSAKTSTLESASTTVYATGGRGNNRLIAWEGEKTLTFTVEDALISPMGLAVLSGAGLFSNDATTVYVHMTSRATVASGKINLGKFLPSGAELCSREDVFVIALDGEGGVNYDKDIKVVGVSGQEITVSGASANETVLVDYYIKRNSGKTGEIQIAADSFGGNYYVEASTLFRREADGKDLPAEITLPNVKIQSNFTFSMASSGDPSTFTFTMDAMPGYTKFDETKKVLCVIQVVEDYELDEDDTTVDSVMKASVKSYTEWRQATNLTYSENSQYAVEVGNNYHLISVNADTFGALKATLYERHLSE